MRLIEASTLKLVSRRENDLPPYAILSHTWGSDEDEVSFQEMQHYSSNARENPSANFAVSRKAGFAKIQQSAELALTQDLSYIWVDTCCIDKSSSAELSEAINSMFRWYQDSTVCYAYLNDTSDIQGLASSVGTAFEISQSIRFSRWFTRGWTLQELVAPTRVEFYSKGWALLGTKNDSAGLQILISGITKIPLSVLDGTHPLLSLGIAERMHWASSRVTTRLEDLAYCLMGIFNVNMPLLYGEGEKAFIRLQKEIMRETSDQSLFAWVKLRDDFTSTLYKSSSGSGETGETGLLAPSPACFKDYGHIKPSPSDMSRTTAPSASTNFGLETHFDLLPAGDESDEFYAILDCAPYIPRHTSSKARAAILLRFLGRNQYVRISSDEIFDIPTLPTSTVSKAIHTRVFVKQHSNSLAPALTLQGLNNIQACGGALTDVWPYDQWDAGKRKHQFLRDRGHVILAAFQFTFVAPVGNHAYLDIMVGQSRRFEDRTSQDLWISCSPSNSRTNLEWEMQNAERNSHHRRTKSVSYVHMIDTIPSVVISVDQQLDQGKESFFLRFDKIHELSVVPEDSARRIDSDDSVIQKYERIIGCVAIEDAASRSLCKNYSPFQEIRTIRPNRPSLCWETLDNLRRSAADSATVVDVSDPSRKPLDTFEAYFSTQLIKTCISGDGPGIEETLNSRLSTVCVNAWTSELRTTVEEFDPLKLLEGFRPLHWAALFGHAEITAVLLYHGADPFLETCTGLTPMHVAIVMGHVGVLDQIFAANPSSKRWIDCTQSCVCDTLPNFAASYIRTEAIASVLDCLSRLLHSDGMVSTFDRPNALGENLLHRASASNNIFAAQWCVQRNRQLVYCRDKHGRTPLFHAAAAGSTEICQMLLDNGADPFAEDHLGRTPLYAACRQGHHLLVESFLQASIPFLQSDSDHTVGLGFNAWHFAALSCNPDVLRSLVPYANRSTATRTDMIGLSTGIAGGGYLVSPLHIASSIGTVSCVEILCRVGFDTTTKTRCGFVPESGSNRWRVEIGQARTAEEWADAYDDAKVVAVLRGFRPWMSGPTSEIAVR